MIFDIQKISMIRCKTMIETRWNHTTCYFAGNVYVFGGIGSENNALQSTERYSLNTNFWHSLQSMEHLVYGSAAEHKEKIYIRAQLKNKRDFLVYEPLMNISMYVQYFIEELPVAFL